MPMKATHVLVDRWSYTYTHRASTNVLGGLKRKRDGEEGGREGGREGEREREREREKEKERERERERTRTNVYEVEEGTCSRLGEKLKGRECLSYEFDQNTHAHIKLLKQ